MIKKTCSIPFIVLSYLHGLTFNRNPCQLTEGHFSTLSLQSKQNDLSEKNIRRGNKRKADSGKTRLAEADKHPKAQIGIPREPLRRYMLHPGWEQELLLNALCKILALYLPFALDRLLWWRQIDVRLSGRMDPHGAISTTCDGSDDKILIRLVISSILFSKEYNQNIFSSIYSLISLYNHG